MITKNLQSLHLGRYIISDENIRKISNLSELTNLEFYKCIFSEVTSDSLNELNKKFRECEIDGDKLNELKVLQKLTSEVEPTPSIIKPTDNGDVNEPTPINTDIKPTNTDDGENKICEDQITITVTKIITKLIAPTSTINDNDNVDIDNNNNDDDSSNDSDSNNSDSDSEDKKVEEVNNKDDYSLNDANEKDEDSDEDDKKAYMEKMNSEAYKFIELVKELIDHLSKKLN